MTGLTHSVRNSMLDRERTYTLGPDALHWREAKREGQFPYEDTVSEQLISYAGTGSAQLQCTLRNIHGHKLKLRSHHFVGLARFEDRTDTYAPFIQELTRRIAAHAPDARFWAGSTGLWVTWLIIAVMLVVLAPLIILSIFHIFSDGTSPGGVAIPAILVAVVCVPLAWREARKGRANSFDPQNPPAQLLGQP